MSEPVKGHYVLTGSLETRFRLEYVRAAGEHAATYTRDGQRGKLVCQGCGFTTEGLLSEIAEAWNEHNEREGVDPAR